MENEPLPNYNFTGLSLKTELRKVLIKCSMCGDHEDEREISAYSTEGLTSWSALHFSCNVGQDDAKHLDICEGCWPKVLDYLLEGAKTWPKRSTTNTP